MTTPDLDHRLSRFYDEDLSTLDAAQLEQELALDAELRGKLAGLTRLSELVRIGGELEVPTDELWAGIQSKLAASVPDSDPMLPSPVRSAPVAALPVRRPRVRAWLPVAAGVLALAAAILLVIWRSQSHAPIEPDPVADAHPAPGSDVEEVDFGYSTGAVFSVEGDEGERYAVIWISDEDETIEEQAPEP